MMKLRGVLACIVVLAFGLATTASAEQLVETDQHMIHYMALSTDNLTPDVARGYNISRSKKEAMLNITVLAKDDTGLGTPAEADVVASATNLAGQRRDLTMRLITEQAAKYYVGFVRVSNEETLDFTVQVTPDGEDEPVEIKFRQQFYTD